MPAGMPNSCFNRRFAWDGAEDMAACQHVFLGAYGSASKFESGSDKIAWGMY